MRDLILHIRTDTIEHHIDRLQDLLALFERRAKDITALGTSVTRGQDEADRLMKGIQSLDAMARERERERSGQGDGADWESVHQELRTLDKQADELYRLLGRAARTIESMQLQAAAFRDQTFRASLAQTVATRTSGYRTEVASIRSQLESDRPGAWKRYTEGVRSPVQGFFAEILDLLGGVALRDTRLDDGICVLADELVTNYRVDSRGPTPILTLPARHRTTEMTLAKTVCVGFPEWTIWALPLTAHEFWYAVGREAVLSKDELFAGIQIDAAMQQCMADAVATWLMGPAYPFAQVLLGLDPFEGYTPRKDEATADDRVFAMVQMLTLMNKAGGTFTNVITELSENWNEALKFTNPSGERNGPRQTEIATVINALHKDKLAYGGFAASSWDNIHELSQKLIDCELPPNTDDLIAQTHRELDKMDLGLPAEPELRHLLNAAWRARVRKPEAADRIEANTQTLWTYLVRKRREPARSTGERVPTVGARR